MDDKTLQKPPDRLTRALSHHKGGELEKAAALYREILQVAPRDADALRYLGILHHQRGDSSTAACMLQQAVEVEPNDISAWYNLGVVLAALDRADAAEAVYRQVLAIKPHHVLAALNLGNLLAERNRYADAQFYYQRAIEADETCAAAYNNLGRLFKNTKRFATAISYFKRAIQIDPAFVGAYSNLAVTYMHLGNANDGIDNFLAAARMNPNQKGYLKDALILVCYTDRLDPQQVFALHKKWGELTYGSPRRRAKRSHGAITPQRKLRIGYLSPDFRRHSVYYFIAPLLAHHDCDKFEIFCYSSVEKPDTYTDRIRALTHRWREVVAMSDEQVAATICEDQIDILIDLAGHTANTRLGVLAMDPAPVQATYLGYPATTGLPSVDYRVTDAYADPPGQTDHLYTETLVRLPGCFLTYAPAENSPDIAQPPQITNGRVTFGSFNNATKITPTTAALWSRVLRALPDAHLVLKAHLLEQADTRHYVLRLFAQNGVRASRVTLLPFFDATADHLNFYNTIDIALDPYPYNGTTTTCEALWMGVPVITLVGPTHYARVGLTLLHSVGLSEFAAHDADSYVRAAVNLANDLDRRAQLRVELRNQLKRSALCDHVTFARGFEAGLEYMWTSDVQGAQSMVQGTS